MMTQYMPSDKYPLREELKNFSIFKLKQLAIKIEQIFVAL